MESTTREKIRSVVTYNNLNKIPKETLKDILGEVVGHYNSKVNRMNKPELINFCLDNLLNDTYIDCFFERLVHYTTSGMSCRKNCKCKNQIYISCEDIVSGEHDYFVQATYTDVEKVMEKIKDDKELAKKWFNDTWNKIKTVDLSEIKYMTKKSRNMFSTDVTVFYSCRFVLFDKKIPAYPASIYFSMIHNPQP